MFNIRLHRARKAAGLSYRALAQLVGLSQTAIKKYVLNKEQGVRSKIYTCINLRSDTFFHRRRQRHRLRHPLPCFRRIKIRHRQ